MKMMTIQAPPSAGIADAVKVLELISDAKKAKALIAELKEAVEEFNESQASYFAQKVEIENAKSEMNQKEISIQAAKTELEADRLVVADLMAKARELEFALDKRQKEQGEKEYEFSQVVSSHQRIHDRAIRDIKEREEAANQAKEEAEKQSQKLKEKLEGIKAVVS